MCFITVQYAAISYLEDVWLNTRRALVALHEWFTSTLLLWPLHQEVSDRVLHSEYRVKSGDLAMSHDQYPSIQTFHYTSQNTKKKPSKFIVLAGIKY